MESHRRSIAKALSWRVCATIITGLVAWAVTREIRFAATIGALDAAFKLGIYYAHERMWNRISLGRTEPPDYQI